MNGLQTEPDAKQAPVELIGGTRIGRENHTVEKK